MSQQGLDFRKKKSVKEKYFFDLTFTGVHMHHLLMGRQKVPKPDFQSQLSMSKIIRIIQIFLFSFFIEKNQIKDRFFFIVIF